MLQEVFVIGGGVSGLAAAVRIAGAGLPVRLLEARGVLGGRATSFVDSRSGEVFDNGQHALMGCYRETFALLDAIGTRHLVEVTPRLEVTSLDERGQPSVLRCPGWPSPLHLLGGVLGWSGVGWRDRLQVLSMAGPLWRARRSAGRSGSDLPCRPTETVAGWLDRHGQGARARSLLWEPLALAALNQPIERAAAPTFVRVLGRVFGPGATDASIALPRRPLAEVFGSPARAFLEARGARVQFGALARVSISGTQVRGVAVRGVTEPASHVVLATPWHTWPSTLLGDTSALAGIVTAAAATASSPIVTVTLAFDRPVLETSTLGLPGRPFQWAFDVAGLAGRQAGSCVALVSSGADDILRCSNADLAKQAHALLASCVEAARPAVRLASRAVREPRATFSLAPGQPSRPGTRTTVRGLYLASDWVDTGLPATIEGAVEAGHRAADALLQDTGVGVAGRADLGTVESRGGPS